MYALTHTAVRMEGKVCPIIGCTTLTCAGTFTVNFQIYCARVAVTLCDTPRSVPLLRNEESGFVQISTVLYSPNYIFNLN